jgi:hypothetical protein
MFTLADLVKMTGAKRRTVQLWSEGGAIKALPVTDRQGSGVHREFNLDEAMVAAVLVPFAEKGLPIGRLIFVGDTIRHWLKDPKEREKLEAARDDMRPIYMVVRFKKSEAAADIYDGLLPAVEKEDVDFVYLNRHLQKVHVLKYSKRI